MQHRYEQISEILYKRILSGEWEIGQKIPGEIELTREFHVGRSTIRETLNTLCQKGVIEKKRGSGTYVIEKRKNMESPILTLNSMGSMIEAADYNPGSVFYGVSHENADMMTREKLKLEENEKVVIVNRERTADNQPVVFSYNIFPEKYVADIFDNGLYGSIFQVLRDKCQIEIDYAETEIKGINNTNRWDEEAMLFLDGPVVLLEQLHFDKKGQPVLFSYDYIRTDLVKLHIRREI